jgi:hypothetical protein
MGPTSNAQRPYREPLSDIDPLTGASIEAFYSDRTLETFGRCGGGWFWWPRRRGYPPAGAAAGPFPRSYAAYRHCTLGTNLGTGGKLTVNFNTISII